MFVEFKKLTPEMTQSEARGFSAEHQIWVDGHFVGSIYVARATKLVSVSFLEPTNRHLNKWWGELNLQEAKDYVMDISEQIELGELQDHYDNVTGYSRVG